MTLCGACAPHPGIRQRHAVCERCGLQTECAVIDDRVTPAPRAVPPASGLRRIDQRKWARR